MKLKELEKRLDKEPENLGLRVTVAGMLHEAGRTAEAVELYRSVAIAYRDRGRRQQAIAVCRSVLELASTDRACIALLAELTAPPTPVPPAPSVPSSPSLPAPPIVPAAPVRRSSQDETPLPRPLPHHLADPTSGQVRMSASDLSGAMPLHEGADTRPGEEPRPDIEGLALAARRISGWISGGEATEPGGAPEELHPDTARPTQQDLSIELETRRQVKIDLDDAITPVRDSAELTLPRDRGKR